MTDIKCLSKTAHYVQCHSLNRKKAFQNGNTVDSCCVSELTVPPRVNETLRIKLAYLPVGLEHITPEGVVRDLPGDIAEDLEILGVM